MLVRIWNDMIFCVLFWNTNVFFGCPLSMNALGKLPGITADGAFGKGGRVNKHASL